MELDKAQRSALPLMLAMDRKLGQIPEDHVEMIARRPVAEWPPEPMEI